MYSKINKIIVSYADNRYRVIIQRRETSNPFAKVIEKRYYERNRSDIRRLNRLDYYTRNMISMIDPTRFSVIFEQPFRIPSMEHFEFIPGWRRIGLELASQDGVK